MSSSLRHSLNTDRRPKLRHLKRARLGFVIFSVVVAIVAFIVIYPFTRDAKANSATLLSADQDGAVRIAIAEIKGNDAKFFEYNTSNKKSVHFFVVRTSDGVYRVATDACKVCFREKKGYHQEGDGMVCNECGHHSHIAEGAVAGDSCSPEGIPRKIEGRMIVIAAADIEAKSDLF